jgi:long-chain acyl-CoA synthetase
LKLDKYISQAMVFGDRKPYIVAILTPNLERLIDWARQENITYIDIEELVNNRKVKDLFASRIDEINSHYPPYKTIKYFAVVPRDFSIEGGELTPTLKMKRKVIYEQYKEIIEELYEANGSGIIAQPKKIILEK